MTTTVPLYTTVPNRSTSPSTFAADMDTRLSEDNARITAANTQAAEVNASALSAVGAAAAAAISAASTGSEAWASGTYALNETAISQINFQDYRCKVAGTRTVDPANDPTNWVPVLNLNQLKISMPANDIDLSTAGYFSKTISGTTTLTVSNVPVAGIGCCFILDLTNGGSAAITWWAGMKWTLGTAPVLTASGRDTLGFMTHDGGTTWTGFLLGKAEA